MRNRHRDGKAVNGRPSLGVDVVIRLRQRDADDLTFLAERNGIDLMTFLRELAEARAVDARISRRERGEKVCAR